jgi:hypothetical protein
MTLQIEDLKKLVEAKGFSVRGTAKNLIERVEENGVSSTTGVVVRPKVSYLRVVGSSPTQWTGSVLSRCV